MVVNQTTQGYQHAQYSVYSIKVFIMTQKYYKYKMKQMIPTALNGNLTEKQK